MKALELGATLFIPATHKDMLDVVSGAKYPNLKSVLVDTEDSLDDLQAGLDAITEMLKSYKKSSVFVFFRPKNIEILKELLSLKGIVNIDGFILPKFSLNNAKEYLQLLENSPYFIMPSIEGSELFNQHELRELKNILLQHKEKIPLVRFGLEDMLGQLKMRRSCDDTLFDYAVTSSVIGNFIAVFKSSGFDVSGGVYPCFKDKVGFKVDVLRDIKEGLISKTIIHPNQIDTINTLYKVTKVDYEEAMQIDASKQAVFEQNGKMAEKNTMNPYSQEILMRVKVYGVVE